MPRPGRFRTYGICTDERAYTTGAAALGATGPPRRGTDPATSGIALTTKSHPGMKSWQRRAARPDSLRNIARGSSRMAVRSESTVLDRIVGGHHLGGSR